LPRLPATYRRRPSAETARPLGSSRRCLGESVSGRLSNRGTPTTRSSCKPKAQTGPLVLERYREEPSGEKSNPVKLNPALLVIETRETTFFTRETTLVFTSEFCEVVPVTSLVEVLLTSLVNVLLTTFVTALVLS